MKSTTVLFLLLIYSFGCNQTSNNANSIKSEMFDISNLPQDWVRLTKTDSGFVIFNSCDAGNLLLTVNKNGILLHGEQEDYEFEIINSVEVNDTIFIKTKLNDSKELQDFKFIWTNKTEQTGRWLTTYSGGHTSDFMFVTADKQSNFISIKQPCRECWGDECDEMVKKLSSSDSTK